MSTAVHGFLQGFLNTRTEMIQEQQKKENAFAEKIRNLAIEGQMKKVESHAKQKAVWEGKIKPLLAAGDTTGAMGEYAQAHGIQDRFKALGLDAKFDASPEETKAALEKAYKSWASGPEPTLDFESIEKIQARRAADYDSVGGPIRELLGLKDEANMVTPYRGLMDAYYKEAKADTGERPATGNMSKLFKLKGKETKFETVRVTRKATDGSESMEILSYAVGEDGDLSVVSKLNLGEVGAPRSKLEITTDEEAALAGRLQSVMAQWEQDPSKEDLIEALSTAEGKDSDGNPVINPVKQLLKVMYEGQRETNKEGNPAINIEASIDSLVAAYELGAIRKESIGGLDLPIIGKVGAKDYFHVDASVPLIINGKVNRDKYGAPKKYGLYDAAIMRKAFGDVVQIYKTGTE